MTDHHHHAISAIQHALLNGHNFILCVEDPCSGSRVRISRIGPDDYPDDLTRSCKEALMLESFAYDARNGA